MDVQALQRRGALLAAAAIFGLFPRAALADTTYASEQRHAAAVGHYARARTMLVEALQEFEEARKLARPDLLVDPEEWRLNVISRTEELNRILDPKPRVTRDGVQFRANKLLIRREKQRLPAVADGAQDSNIYGEQSRRAEMRGARAHAEMALEDDGAVQVERSDASKAAPQKATAMPSREDQERAARSLSFQDGEVQQAEVLKPEEEDAVAPPPPAPAAGAGKAGVEKEARAALKPAAPPPAVLPNEEEKVTTKRAEGLVLTPPAKNAETSPAAAKGSDPSQQDVEKAIEQAIQQKIQAEHGNGAAADDER